MNRCQICGRNKGLTKSGGVGQHYVAGLPCPGVGHPPIEHADDHLAATADAMLAEYREAAAELAALVERRANYIDPALKARASYCLTMAGRLQRRLARHRKWPERFARQMERQGWGDPPPPYLTARAATPAAFFLAATAAGEQTSGTGRFAPFAQGDTK